METNGNGSNPQRASSLEGVKTSEVPFVTTLRENLGFGSGASAHSKVFIEAIKQFASEFTTEDRSPASTFTKWSKDLDRKVCLDMANGFLEKRGREFWPDSSVTQRYQYERDHAQLQNQLGQLFFRENELAKKKPSRKSASVKPNESTAREPRRDGLTIGTAVDIDDPDSLSEYTSGRSGHGFGTVSPKAEPGRSPSSTLRGVPEETCPERPPTEGSDLQPSRPLRTQTEDMPMEDTYDGPHSSETPTSTSNARGKRPAPPQHDENDRRTKTPRRNEETPNEAETYVPQYFTPTLLQEAGASSPISGRVRQPFHRQGYIMGNECLERLQPYADKPNTRRKKTREVSARSTRPPMAAPMAVMTLESVETRNVVGNSRHVAGDDPFEVAPEGSASRANDDTEQAAGKLSRSPTMGLLPNLGEGSLPEPDFQLGNEPAFQPETSVEAEQVSFNGEEQHRVEVEQRQSQQSNRQSTVNEFRSNSETGNIPSTNIFNIDYTVYNDEEEPVSGWTPPKHFFAMSFDELVKALPLKQPRGLRLCLEGAIKRKGFSRTACDQERFKLHQSRFGEMMRSWEDEVASKGGPKPSFEIIIEPLK
ncbi:hypothetical protein ACHAPT_000228 [Fusarium lateritium]